MGWLILSVVDSLTYTDGQVERNDLTVLCWISAILTILNLVTKCMHGLIF